jgi:DNA-binding response OmpR family regulator
MTSMNSGHLVDDVWRSPTNLKELEKHGLLISVLSQRRFVLMTTPPCPKHILVCDDQDDILDMLSHTLTIAGHTVSTAHDHGEFMERFHKHKPELILLDIYLPEHDGFWIAEHLPCNHRIPIIFMTAHDRPVYRLCAPMVGAEDYVSKPFDPGVLLGRIERVLHPNPRSSTRFLEAICDEHATDPKLHA